MIVGVVNDTCSDNLFVVGDVPSECGWDWDKWKWPWVSDDMDVNVVVGNVCDDACVDGSYGLRAVSQRVKKKQALDAVKDEASKAGVDVIRRYSRGLPWYSTVLLWPSLYLRFEPR